MSNSCGWMSTKSGASNSCRWGSGSEKSKKDQEKCEAFLLKAVMFLGDWFRRTFPGLFTKLLEHVAKEENSQCREDFVKIFNVPQNAIPWRNEIRTAEEEQETQPSQQQQQQQQQGTPENLPESPDFKYQAFTGGLSEEEQLAAALEESKRNQNTDVPNNLYPNLPASAPPSEASAPPSYDSLYDARFRIPAARIPQAPPSEPRH